MKVYYSDITNSIYLVSNNSITFAAEDSGWDLLWTPSFHGPIKLFTKHMTYLGEL